jgi:hypothetical protein
MAIGMGAASTGTPTRNRRFPIFDLIGGVRSGLTVHWGGGDGVRVVAGTVVTVDVFVGLAGKHIAGAHAVICGAD